MSLKLALSFLVCICAFAQTETGTYDTWNIVQNGPVLAINDRGQILGTTSQPGPLGNPTNYLCNSDFTCQTFNMYNPSVGMGVMGHAVAFNVLDQFVGSLDFGLDDPWPFYLYQNGLNVLTNIGIFPLDHGSNPVYGYPTAINDAGAILGEVVQENGAHLTTGVLYSNSVLKVIAFPNAAATYPLAINDSGTIVGYYAATDGSSHGFILRNGKYQGFDVPLAKTTTITGINNIGEFVGNYTTGAKGKKKNSFLYSAGKLTPLVPPSGLSASGPVSVVGIDDEGEIAGNIGSTGFVARPSYFLGYSQ